MKFKTLLFAVGLFAFHAAWASPAVVSHAWVRPTVAGQTVAGAYLDITAKQKSRLIAVRSPVSPQVQIHWMQMDGEVMRMREVAGIDLPKNTKVSLKPGGYHLMLMQLKKPMRTGETIPLTLVIEAQGKRETIRVKALVQSPPDNASGAAHDHAHMHH